jgi:hypothetical protein
MKKTKLNNTLNVNNVLTSVQSVWIKMHVHLVKEKIEINLTLFVIV